MVYRIALTLLVGTSTALSVSAAPRSSLRLASAISAGDTLPPLAHFLVGNWHCVGGSPTGRKIASTLSYVATLGDRWLTMRADDDAPRRYHAMGMWALDTASKEVPMNVFDNFGGVRLFHGRWGSDSITWQRERPDGSPLESFTYVKRAADSYWYAWHLSRTAGSALVLGDSVTCRRG